MKTKALVFSILAVFIISLTIAQALDTSIESAGTTSSSKTVGPACVEIIQGKLLKQADETTFDKVIFVPIEIKIVDQKRCDSLKLGEYSNLNPTLSKFSLDNLLVNIPDNTITTISGKRALLTYNDFSSLMVRNVEKINAKTKATMDIETLTLLKSLDETDQRMLSLFSQLKGHFLSTSLAFPDPATNTGEVYLSIIPPSSTSDDPSYSQILFKNMVFKKDKNSNPFLNFTDFYLSYDNVETLFGIDYVVSNKGNSIKFESNSKADFYLKNLKGPQGTPKSNENMEYMFKQIKIAQFNINEGQFSSGYIKTNGINTQEQTDSYYYFPNRFAVFPDENGEVEIFTSANLGDSLLKGLNLNDNPKGWIVFVPKKVLLKGINQITTKGTEITSLSLDKTGRIYYGYPNALNTIINVGNNPLELGFSTSDKLLNFKSDWTLELSGNTASNSDIDLFFNSFEIILNRGVTSKNSLLSLGPATAYQKSTLEMSPIKANAAYTLPTNSEENKITLYALGKREDLGSFKIIFKLDEKDRINSLIESAQRFESTTGIETVSTSEKELNQASKTNAIKAKEKVEIPSPKKTEPSLQELQKEKLKIVKVATVAASAYDPCKMSFSGYSCMTPKPGTEITEPLTSVGNYKYECKITMDCKDSKGNKVWCCSGGFETRCCKKTSLQLPSSGSKLQLPLESITNNLKDQIKTSKEIFPSSGLTPNLKTLEIEYPQADATSTSGKLPAALTSSGYKYLNEFKANGKTYYNLRSPEGEILKVGQKANGDPDMAPALYGAITAMPKSTPQNDNQVETLIKYYKDKYASTAGIFQFQGQLEPKFTIAKWEFIIEKKYDQDLRKMTYPFYREILGDKKGIYMGRLIPEANYLRIQLGNTLLQTPSTLGLTLPEHFILSNTKIAISESQANSVWPIGSAYGLISYPSYPES